MKPIYGSRCGNNENMANNWGSGSTMKFFRIVLTSSLITGIIGSILIFIEAYILNTPLDVMVSNGGVVFISSLGCFGGLILGGIIGLVIALIKKIRER